ncbi:MAG: hypothetical protein ACREBP_10085 [Sphingomicrobium sp.]
MFKAMSALAAASCVAAAIAFFPGFSQVEASTPAPVVKGDRLDIRVLGSGCSQRSWPYYEAACLRDRSQNGGRAREVRIVSGDRKR